MMTDRDIVERVAGLWHRAVVPLRARKAHHKPPFATTIKGPDAVSLMVQLRPELSAPRQRQIDAAVAGRTARPAGLFAHERPDRSCGHDCELAWLAGLLEGEAWFGISRVGQHAYPGVSLEMACREVVERACRLMGVTTIQVRRPAQAHWDVTFKIALTGDAAAKWMRTLRPLMGQRRGAAIDAALAGYAPIRLIDPPETCIVPDCAEPHRSRGLCHKHYMSWMRDQEKGRRPRVTPLR